MESSNDGLWNILFGSADSRPSTQDLGSFEPAYARMSIAFNDYVFSEQDVEEYFKKELGL